MSTGIGRGTLDDGTQIPAEDVRRLACDALIIPAVLGSTSQPLDIGRATRVVPAGMRRALILRDRHCAFPGSDHRQVVSHPPHHVLVDARRYVARQPCAALRAAPPPRPPLRLDVVMGTDGRPVFHPPPWLHPDITMADPTWRVRINTDYGGPPGRI